MNDGEVYSGDQFSISQHGNDWTIWRYTGQEFADDRREELILTTDAMTELAEWFASEYPVPPS